MTTGMIQIDLNKIQTIEEVKAVLILLVMAHGQHTLPVNLQVHTGVVNHMPILNNLVKDIG